MVEESLGCDFVARAAGGTGTFRALIAWYWIACCFVAFCQVMSFGVRSIATRDVEGFDEVGEIGDSSYIYAVRCAVNYVSNCRKGRIRW